MPILKEIAFFKERDLKDEDLCEIVQYLRYECIAANKEVFHYNSRGDKFYIILKGLTRVLIPNPNKKKKKKPEDNDEDEDEKDMPDFIQLATMSDGKSFGELALIHNKPRAASIETLDDTHFAVMSKTDYDKSLSKIEQKNLNKVVEFFAAIPCFSHWTRTALSKLTFSFQLKIYN